MNLTLQQRIACAEAQVNEAISVFEDTYKLSDLYLEYSVMHIPSILRDALAHLATLKGEIRKRFKDEE